MTIDHEEERTNRMSTQFQQSLIEMIARNEPIATTADQICRQAESFAPGVACSMVTVDRSGTLHPLAGPALPDAYSAALDGIAIGPAVGSCGSAAYLRRSVAVTDIFADDRWAPYKQLVEPLGMRACWSSPIIGGGEQVLGAFGFYYRDPRGPSADEQRLVADCTALSAILLGQQELRVDNYRLTAIDPLTGLGNRASLDRALTDASRRAGKRSLLLIDIDGLRRVNEDFGYAMGDRLVQTVGQRLGSKVRRGEAFRIAGGEFAVLLDSRGAGDSMSNIAARLLAVLQEPAWCGRHLLSPTVTCGGATLHPLLLVEPERLWRQADLALREAKETLRGGFIHFNEHATPGITQRTKALQITRRALSENRVEAHYQPIVQLESRSIIGLEALFRVRGADGDIIPAEKLAAALEVPSTASSVTKRMLALVTHDIRRWLDQGITLPHIGVNVSMADFLRDDLYEQISDACSLHGVPLSHLMLEITETVNLDDDDGLILRAVERLRAEGVCVALDDFGTGYASVTHLASFPADIIKTDKSLVEQLSSGRPVA